MAREPNTVLGADRLKKASLVAGVAAAISAAGMRNVMASTFLTVAGPLTAAGFVYEVQVLRDAQLAHEAADRAHYSAYLAAQANESNRLTPPALSDLPPQLDVLSNKLDSMIRSRDVLLDTFGGEATSVAPVYHDIIKRMLKDDDAAFASLAETRSKADPYEAAKLSAKESRLREVHAQLARLAGG